MQLLIFISITITYAFIEANHDINVIESSEEYSIRTRDWHIYGMIINGGVFILLATVSALLTSVYIATITFIVTGTLFWQLHDSIIGWYFYKQPFYLSERGLDGWLDRVFWGGFNLAIIRVGIIACGILEYFRSI